MLSRWHEDLAAHDEAFGACKIFLTPHHGARGCCAWPRRS